ncbi:MAG: DUF3795 domain-containing protein [Longicatena sp.]|uniref:DUF3795 domain-containing protein n=1 Tax=Anaerorhabdus sp. TaxID=1872524 RepID=UPI002FCC4E9D
MEKLPYGYCGMPCALCPYYHTKGISRCKGCSHDGFFTGACNIYKCCKKKESNHCAVCEEYPCKKCATLKEFNCLNTNSAWLSTVSMIQSQGFEKWYDEYQRMAELLSFALEHYNNGRMKRYLCELFINNTLQDLEIIMDNATSLTGTKKEVALKFKELTESI